MVVLLMLLVLLLITPEVCSVMSLGMQNLLSELLVINKGATLLYYVALLMSIWWHFKLAFLSVKVK